jgi:hypothetical protein
MAGSDDRTSAALHATVQRLAPRWFVLRDLHDGGEPVLFQPRQAMSFQRGPMTRAEMRRAVRWTERRGHGLGGAPSMQLTTALRSPSQPSVIGKPSVPQFHGLPVVHVA